MKKIFLFTLAGLTSLFLFGCEEEEDAKIFAAQQCIDTATSATADACLSSLSGLTSVQSYVLRCAADFIKAGITETTIATALENVDTPGNDPTATIIENFKFSSTAAADVAVTNCNATGSATLIALVNTARMATVLTEATGCIGTTDPSTYIGSYNPGDCTGTSAENLGNVLIDSQETMCGTTGLYKGTEVCTNLDAAIANNPGNAAAIADQFLQNAE